MQKHRFQAVIFALLTVAAFAGGIAYAKVVEGALVGVVLNGKGAPVNAAEVFWQTADGKAPHAARTDASGKFRIRGIRQGLYDVRAESAGMTSEWAHNIIVRPGTEASVTLRLSRAIVRPAAASPSPRPSTPSY